MKRIAVLVSAVALFSLVFAAPTLAAVPGNDTYAARVVIGSLPFSDTLDTTDATTDADDAEANANCGAPATDASVWYELAGTDSAILVDVSASDYSAGVIVVSGSPGSFVIESCGPGAVGFFAASGQTYAILAFDDQGDGSGNGGTLNITIDVAPPPPTVDVTVNPIGQFNKLTGSATVSGTVTCTGAADFTYIEVQLTQTVGRFNVSGYGLVESAFVCDGTAQPWSVEVFGNGLFKGGRAASVTIAVAYSAFGSGYDIEERNIMLRG